MWVSVRIHGPFMPCNLSLHFFPCKQTTIQLKELRRVQMLGVTQIIRERNYQDFVTLELPFNWEIKRLIPKQTTIGIFQSNCGSYNHKLYDNCGCMGDNHCHWVNPKIDNPLNSISAIFWLACVGSLEESGIAWGTVKQRMGSHSLGCAYLWGKGLWIRIVVSVNIGCEHGKWVVRREIRVNDMKSFPSWIHSLGSGWPLL
jgi:hypothetical protein